LALRLVFMGTPDFAVPTLLKLVDAGHHISAVYTRAPRPAGRGLEPRPAAVTRAAEKLGIAVFTPKTLTHDEAAETMRAHDAAAAVVAAYGLILPKAILEVFPSGAYNLHASLLPRWRGAAPIQRAIMAGDRETGATVMKMDEGLDTGPTATAERIRIEDDMTAGELHDRLAQRGADLMVRALAALEQGTLRLTPQAQAGVVYADKIDKNETRIDWRESSREVHDHCRGLSPFPGAWCELAGCGRIKVLRSMRADGVGAPGCVLDGRLTIACGEGAVRLIAVQRAGRQPMSAEEFLRGLPVAPGTMLS
jgi:methionyl-tRNA formyltransferase